MSTALRSYAEYARLIFTLLADRDTVESHTVAVYTVSQTIGVTRGRIVFRSGHVLHVFEQVDFVTHRILKYFYELTYQGESLWWYDPMPHPGVAELQSTDPHHKHVPPDPSAGSEQSIKHHRIPPPDLSFTQPNLPFLIAEVEQESLCQ